MPRAEWGPKNVPTEGRMLFEITRFSGVQLQDIAARVSEYLETHTAVSRDEAVSAISKSGKNAARIQLGLDTLNQLHLTGRNASDVKSVIVRQDMSNIVQKAQEGEREKTGQGKGHLWYEIDWIREPEGKPAVLPQSGRTNTKPLYPGRTSLSRAVNSPPKLTGLERVQAKDEARRQQEAWRAGRIAIDRVVIDTVAESAQYAIDVGQVKIELDEGGHAVISMKGDLGFGEYRQVDRQTGNLILLETDFPEEKRVIVPPQLRYLNVIAQQTEGKKAFYEPDPLDSKVAEDVYQRAVRSGMIKVEGDAKNGIRFEYVMAPDVRFSGYTEIDLEKSIVIIKAILLSKRIRPVNPHFAEFLKRKKAELEKQPTI